MKSIDSRLFRRREDRVIPSGRLGRYQRVVTVASELAHCLPITNIIIDNDTPPLEFDTSAYYYVAVQFVQKKRSASRRYTKEINQKESQLQE